MVESLLKQGWFYGNELNSGVSQALKVKRNIYSGKSKFQNVRILETYTYGRVLVLDEVVQLTEKDEFVYHDMFVHVPMLSLPRLPEKVLVIGGGDGGVIREVLKYPVEKVYMVEIDGLVIELAKKYLRSVCGKSFWDSRLKLLVEDGACFTAETKERFDLVILDISDNPSGPVKTIFGKTFLENVKKILAPDGAVVRQAGASFLQAKEIRDEFAETKEIFPVTKLYLATVPAYTGGFYTFIWGSRKTDPEKISIEALKRKMTRYRLKTDYYTPEVHRAAFVLPNNVKKDICA